jgi:hypothetical protein
MEARQCTLLGCSIIQATTYSRMFSPHCGSVVVLYHVKKHLVFLEVAEALTTTPTCHNRKVAMLCLCCTVVVRTEITSYVSVQIKLFELLIMMVCI